MPKKSDTTTDLNLPEKRVFIGNASLWKRVAAFILDILLLDLLVLGFYDSIIASIIDGAGSVKETVKHLQSSDSLSTVIVMLFFLLTLMVLAYFVLQEYMLGQTVGKMLLGLRVVAVGDGQISDISFFQSLIRSMFIIPTIPFIFLWIVDPVFTFFNKEQQRFSEWLCRTKVIEVYQFG
ncbi:TPA: RDD family protein [Candidatus Woesearchaeota archaeon]|nr:RDD family protein [Candidatus Woesearchaeota archaeon]